MILGPEDLLRINELLLDLHRAKTPDEQTGVILATLNALVPSAVVCWTRFNVRTRELAFVTLPPIPIPREHVAELGRVSHQSPFPAYFAVSRDRSWRMLTDFMPAEDFQQTELFQRMFAPIQCAHQISTMISSLEHDQISLTLCRPEPGFTERDRVVLNCLLPHLALSYCNAEALAQARQSAAEFQAVIESAALGYAGVQPDGALRWATTRARELWRRFYPEEATASSGLPAPVEHWLRSALDLAHGHTLPGAETRNGSDGQRLEMRLLPSPFEGWIIALEACNGGVPQRFRPLPRLSERQNEVLRWMVEGKRNAEIAVIIQISVRTVEKHVAEVLQKLEAENRATAIVRALEAAAGAPPYQI